MSDPQTLKAAATLVFLIIVMVGPPSAYALFEAILKRRRTRLHRKYRQAHVKMIATVIVPHRKENVK